MSDIKAGDKVRAIIGFGTLVKGNIYVVDHVEKTEWSDDDMVFVVTDNGVDGWYASRFEKVEEEKPVKQFKVGQRVNVRPGGSNIGDGEGKWVGLGEVITVEETYDDTFGEGESVRVKFDTSGAEIWCYPSKIDALPEPTQYKIGDHVRGHINSSDSGTGVLREQFNDGSLYPFTIEWDEDGAPSGFENNRTPILLEEIEGHVETTPAKFEIGSLVKVIADVFEGAPRGTIKPVKDIQHGMIVIDAPVFDRSFYKNEVEPYTLKIGDRVRVNAVPGFDTDVDKFATVDWEGSDVTPHATFGARLDAGEDWYDGQSWSFNFDNIIEVNGTEPEVEERKDHTDLVERADMLINAHEITGGKDDYTAKTLRDLRDALVEESYL